MNISGTSTYTDVIVKVVRPSGTVVFFDMVQVTGGQFSTSFTLGSNEAAGTYKVVAGQGNDVANKDLFVTAASSGCTSNCGGVSGSITQPGEVTSTDGRLTLPVGSTGHVSLSDEVTISIPANASSQELKLTIEKLTNASNLLSEGDVLASPIFEILKNFTDNFSKPITLTFAFDPTKLGTDQRAAVFYYDETKKVWVEVAGGTVNGNHIAVEVNHFTKYAVFAVANTEVAPITFSDIAGHWAEANIKQAVKDGIVKGYPDGTFQPDATVTRAEFAVMLINALKPEGEGAELKFTDADKIGAWAKKAIAQAVQAGIIKGYDDGSFRPDAQITRAEMASMLAKASGKTIEAKATAGFADDKEIPAWAISSVAYVKQAGIMQGKGHNAFAPQDQATRAEAVMVLLNRQAVVSK
ncbi:S-layer homology domain-containing protein [Cohnella yongneupensis]|uniref:S-layer homology domain-containing protein n=1 Tax=Cohnella yongneupensis TaxID=425006 RepID=A0ABW0R1G5_9BACL